MGEDPKLEMKQVEFATIISPVNLQDIQYVSLSTLFVQNSHLKSMSQSSFS